MKHWTFAQRGLAAVTVVATGRGRPGELAGGWRRRRPSFDSLETRRLLSTNVAEFPVPVEGGSPVGIASGAGSDKNVWFTLDSNNIGMINPEDTAAGVTQYPIPTPSSGDGPIAAGPDGNYWFFEEAADKFGFINPTTGVITEIPLLSISNPEVEGITAGPNGSVWFTASNTSQIGEINTANDQITLFPTSTPGAEPYGIVEGPDGNIWFTEYGVDRVGMINPTTHAMQEFPIDSSKNDEAEGITVGPDGNLWFTLTRSDKIGVMSTSGSMLEEYPVPTAYAEPDSITQGPDGNLWFTDSGLSGTNGVANITVAGKVTEFKIPQANPRGPDAITSGSDGNLWFGMTPGDYQYTIFSISPITPNSVNIYSYTETEVDNPNGIVADDNGNLWFTQQADNQVGEFNPTTGFMTYLGPAWTEWSTQGIALGSDGNIYYAGFNNESGSEIGVIDPSKGTIENYETNVTDSDPIGIVYDPSGGDLWFTENGLNAIGQFNPKTKAMSDFQIPTLVSGPQDITVAPNGDVWFVETLANQFAVLDPNNPGSIKEYHDYSGTEPNGIVADSSGNIWVSEYNAINEYNPSTGALIKQYTVPGGHGAGALTLGPDGDIWFAAGGNIGSLSSSGTFQFYPAAGDPYSITSTADGDIWFTVSNSNTIGVLPLSATSNPTQLAVTTQPPGSVTAAAGFGLVVGVENSAGQPDIDYSGTVTIALASNPGGDTLQGTLTATANQGVAIFSGLTLKVPDSGYTITATASGLSSTTTDPFNVTLGATQLVVTSQPPASVPKDAAFSITVSAEDGLGNIDTSYNQAVTLSLENANGATLSGVLTVGANDGVATFTGLSVNQSGTGYVIQASSGSLTSTTTDSFDVTLAGPPYQLVVANGAEPPSSVVAGESYALTIDAEDQYGNLATTFDGSVSLAISNSSSVTLQGNVTGNASDGVISFPGLSIDTVGSYTIAATSAGLVTATTSAVNVTPGQAVQLVVTPANEPSGTIVAGGTFGFIVDAEDSFNNLDPTFDGLVTLAASPSVTIQGTPSATAQNGVATFSGLSIDTVGVYTIQASSGSLNHATTTSITVTPGALWGLYMSAQPAGPIAAGATFGLSVGGADQFGNPIASFGGSVTIALAGNPGPELYGTLTETTQGGVATFSGLTMRLSGTYSILATDTGLVSATSNPFVITSSTATQLLVKTQPTVATAGAPFTPGFVIVELDQYGNLVSSDNSTRITVTMASGSGQLQGSTKVMVVGGIATFTNLYDDKAELIILSFAGGGLPAVTSSSLTVVAGQAATLTVTEPPSGVVAGIAFEVTVIATDGFGNTATSFNGLVTIVLVVGSGGNLSGTTTVTASGGIATFTDLISTKSGSISLVASSGSSLNSPPTPSIPVTPAPASVLVISTSPSSTQTAGAPFQSAPVIFVEDSYGNVETGDNTTQVTVSLSSGTGPLQGTLQETVHGGVATFVNLADDRAETITLGFSGGGLSAGPSSAIVVQVGPAVKLGVAPETTAPSLVPLGGTFSLVVAAEDDYGNIETQYTSNLTVGLVGSNVGLAGNTSLPAQAGVATFTSLSIDTLGNYTLQVTGGSLAALTLPLSVQTPVPSALVVTNNPPASVAAGMAFSLDLEVVDQFGNLAPGYTGSVTVTVATNPEGATLAAPYSTEIHGGLVSLSGLTMDKAGSGFTFQVTSGNLAPATTGSFDVTALAATKLVVTTQPTNVVAGTPFGLVLTAEDEFGNPDPEFDGSVTVSLSGNPAHDTLGGSLIETASAGVLTCTDLVLKKAASGDIIEATAPGLSAALTSVFSVTAAPAVRLVVTTAPPSPVIVGIGFTIVIEAQDPYGNVDRSFHGDVTIVLANNSGEETLGGTLTAQAVAGVATFTGLTLNQPTSGYQLQISSGTLPVALTITTPVVVPPPSAPTILHAYFLKVQPKNNKGKPVGKPIEEVELVFSTAMNSSNANLYTNYQVSSVVIKKKSMRTYQPVKINAVYNPTTKTVSLLLPTNQKFANGGLIKVNTAPPHGVSSAAGVALSSEDTTLTINRKLMGVSID